MKRSYLVVFLASCFILPAAQINAEPGTSAKKMYMTFARKENTYDGRLLRLFYTEAFKRIGKELVIVFYPEKRANLMLENGEVDGDIARVHYFNKHYPNMIRVEEPIGAIMISAFVTNPDITLKGWESLRNTDYYVEYMRGAKLGEMNLPKIVDKERLSQVSHWTQGLKKLVSGRTDVYIAVQRTVLQALKTNEFKNAGIHIAGVMEKTTVHAFLHEKHKHIVPKLSTVMKEMKNEGMLEKFKKIASEIKD